MMLFQNQFRRASGGALCGAIVTFLGGGLVFTPALAQTTQVGQNITVTELEYSGNRFGGINIAFDQIGSSERYAVYINNSLETLLTKVDPADSQDYSTELRTREDYIPAFAHLASLTCTSGAMPRCASMRPQGATELPINYRNAGGSSPQVDTGLLAGSYYIAVEDRMGLSPGPRANTPYTPAADALGGAENPIIFPGTSSNLALNANTLSWSQAEHTYTSFEIFYATEAGVSDTSSSQTLSLGADGVSCTSSGATRDCTYDIAGLNLPATPHFFKLASLGSTDPTSGNALRSGLSSDEVTGTPPPAVMPMPGGGSNGSGSAPADSGGSSSGGAIALVAIAGGAYLWWKKRQIANGNVAAVAFLPDVDFDLDRNDRRAFYTKMNWQNPGGSNWQLRGNASVHTKYSGKLLDWHADSHIGYRLNGKFGEFNPYLRGKFVQNHPENAKMEEAYTLGVNYSVPNRFSAQFLQPDDQIWRYSLKTEMHLPKGIRLRFNQPNSDIWQYSANLNWQISERIGLNLSQPSNDLPNYGFGIQWRNKSKIRYGLHGETGSNSYRLRGEFWF